jgi:hypothetical protein
LSKELGSYLTGFVKWYKEDKERAKSEKFKCNLKPLKLTILQFDDEEEMQPLILSDGKNSIKLWNFTEQLSDNDY